ncbi:hypothetical protein [Sporolactobacillus sp. KGMB 08714]
MKVIYIRWHNNYDFVLGREYEAQPYKEGWLLVDGQLYREGYFKKV